MSEEFIFSNHKDSKAILDDLQNLEGNGEVTITSLYSGAFFFYAKLVPLNEKVIEGLSKRWPDKFRFATECFVIAFQEGFSAGWNARE
jgi:hypothetical protein